MKGNGPWSGSAPLARVRSAKRTGHRRIGVRSKTLCRCGAGLVSLILTYSFAAGQESFTSKAPNFRADSDLVIIPLSVTDRTGRTVLALTGDDFKVTEGSVPQKILSVSRWDGPVSMGLIIDVSGSMEKGIRSAREAVRILFADKVAGDEAFLITVDDVPRLELDFTDDTDEIPNKLLFVSPQGSTALFDAIYLGLHRMKSARTPHRVLVVMTDCGDNHSRYSSSEVLSTARESDVQINTLEPAGGASGREQARGRWKLKQLAQETGGQFLTADRTRQLPQQMAKLSELIRNQFLIAYRPQPLLRDGKWHKVRVRVKPSPNSSQYRTYTRAGYYAPWR